MVPISSSAAMEVVHDSADIIRAGEVNKANQALDIFLQTTMKVAIKAIGSRYNDQFAGFAPNNDLAQLISIKGKNLPIISCAPRVAGGYFDALVTPDGNLHRVKVENNRVTITFMAEPDDDGNSMPLISDIDGPPKEITFIRTYTTNDTENIGDSTSLMINNLDDNELLNLDFTGSLWSINPLPRDTNMLTIFGRSKNIANLTRKLFDDFAS